MFSNPRYSTRGIMETVSILHKFHNGTHPNGALGKQA